MSSFGRKRETGYPLKGSLWLKITSTVKCGEKGKRTEDWKRLLGENQKKEKRKKKVRESSCYKR